MGKKKTEKEEKIMCSSCGDLCSPTSFPPSYSFKNRKTKRLEICKPCCGVLYDKLVLEYDGDELKALYRLCMMEDIYFSSELANSIINNSKNSDKNYGFSYVSKLGLVQYRNKTFKDTTEIMNIFNISEKDFKDILFLNVEKSKEQVMKEAKQMVTPEIIARWGKDFTMEDYMFLEERYNIMINTYDDKNPASLWDYQEMCVNYLLLRKERGNPQAQKNLQDIVDRLQKGCKMKITQLDNSEDDSAVYGRKIDRIENYEPCDKKLPFFDDIDNIRKYIKKWFTQPTAKQLEVSRDVAMEGENVGDYEDLSEIFKERGEDNGN